MKRKPCLFAVLMLPILCGADDGKIVVQFSDKSDLRDVMQWYSVITGRTIRYMGDVHAKVAIVTPDRVSKPEALQLIRKTLLEKRGIEVKDGDKNESLVTWSDDPQYKEVRAEAEKAPIDPPASGVGVKTPDSTTPGAQASEPRKRIRIIRPEEKPK